MQNQRCMVTINLMLAYTRNWHSSCILILCLRSLILAVYGVSPISSTL